MTDKTAATRDMVFFLEDNADVLDSTASFFEIEGVPSLRALTVDEAWTTLEKWHENIRCAYIDKTLQRDQNAGVTFLQAARARYPEIDYALLTAWNLDSDERARLAEAKIGVIEKTQVRPAELLARYHRGGHAPISHGPDDLGVEDAAESAASTADLLFSSRLQEDVLKRREERFVGRVGRLARDLVQRMREDKQFGNGPIYIGASEYTTDELIHEICEGTELGMALIDAHFAEVEEMGQRFYGARR